MMSSEFVDHEELHKHRQPHQTQEDISSPFPSQFLQYCSIEESSDVDSPKLSLEVAGLLINL